MPIIEFGNLCIMFTKSQSDSIERIQRKITIFIMYKMGRYNHKYYDRL